MSKLGWCLSIGQEHHARCWGRTPGGLKCGCEPCHGHEPWFTKANEPGTIEPTTTEGDANDDEE